MPLHRDEQRLVHRQLRIQEGVLEAPDDPEVRTQLGREPSDVLAERGQPPAALRRDVAGHTVHERRLARAVAADESDDLAGFDTQVKVRERLHTAVVDGDGVRDERRLVLTDGFGSSAVAAPRSDSPNTGRRGSSRPDLLIPARVRTRCATGRARRQVRSGSGSPSSLRATRFAIASRADANTLASPPGRYTRTINTPTELVTRRVSSPDPNSAGTPNMNTAPSIAPIREPRPPTTTSSRTVRLSAGAKSTLRKFAGRRRTRRRRRRPSRRRSRSSQAASTPPRRPSDRAAWSLSRTAMSMRPGPERRRFDASHRQHEQQQESEVVDRRSLARIAGRVTNAPDGSPTNQSCRKTQPVATTANASVVTARNSPWMRSAGTPTSDRRDRAGDRGDARSRPGSGTSRAQPRERRTRRRRRARTARATPGPPSR